MLAKNLGPKETTLFELKAYCGILADLSQENVIQTHVASRDLKKYDNVDNTFY